VRRAAAYVLNNSAPSARGGNVKSLWHACCFC
jgi:hypothetical protein